MLCNCSSLIVLFCYVGPTAHLGIEKVIWLFPLLTGLGESCRGPLHRDFVTSRLCLAVAKSRLVLVNEYYLPYTVRVRSLILPLSPPHRALGHNDG